MDRRFRKGALRTALFLALLGAAMVAADALVNHGLRRIETSGFGVWNRIVQGRVRAEVLVSGSSRALNHYDPTVLEHALGRSVHNIGLNGSRIDMQLARLRVYLRHNPAPKLLVQNLDYFSLQASPGEVYDPAQYVPYLHEPALYGALQRVHADAWKWRHLPLYAYTVADLRLTWLKGVAAALGWQPREDLVQGFQPRRQGWTDEFDRFVRTHRDGTPAVIDGPGVQALEELLALCRQHGVAVVLVYSPEYLGMHARTRGRAQVFARFEALARAHGVPLWDWSGSPLSAQRRWFVNSQHLNAEGAARFSQELAAGLEAVLPAEHAAQGLLVEGIGAGGRN